jgi:hypothetical protein
MANTDRNSQQTFEGLRLQIASAISAEKSYNVPAICRRYGLRDGDEQEAFQSKNKYVQSRLKEISDAEVLRIAREVHNSTGDHDLGEILAKLDEQKAASITELTRRRVVGELQTVDIPGQLPLMEFLGKLWPLVKMTSPQYPGTTLEDLIHQHCVRNYDMDNREMLEAVGIMTCSQAKFFEVLEAIVDPMVRDETEQQALVTKLNAHLTRDKFVLAPAGNISGSPIYKVRRTGGSGLTPADNAITSTLAALSETDVHERWEKALKRRGDDPAGAITIARTLLEDVCKMILSQAGETYENSDDLPKLYRKVAKLMKLAPDDHTEDAFRRILGSCQSIVETLGTLRNRLGDAHSSGPKPAKPLARHAELAVNLAGTMATFLVTTWQARQKPNV